MTKLKSISLVIAGLITGCSGNAVKEMPASAPVQVQGEVVPADKLAKKNKPAQKKELATAIDPKVMYLLLAAELAGQRNQYDVALEGYMQAATRVDDSRVTERAAKIASFLDDTKKADQAVTLWLKQDANNIEAHTLAALMALRSGRKTPALTHLDKLLALDPAGFDNTLLELLKSLGQTERVDFLASVLEDLALKHPDQAVIYFVQSLLAMQGKDNALAAQKIKHVLELKPGWDKALLAEAQLAVLNDDLESAEQLLRNAVAKYPSDLRFKRMLAQVLIKAAKYDAALAEYQAILKEHADDADSMFSLALLHMQLQQDKEAKPYLNKLASHPQWSGQASYYLGKLAAKSGQFEKSLVWFDSVTNGPLELDAALSAVAVVVEQKRFDEAHKRLDKMQHTFPNQSVKLLAMRAEIFNDQKQFDRAYKMLSDALIKSPGQKELLYTRALVAEHMDDLPSMEADLKAILVKYPDDVATLNALGYTLVDKTKRYKEAERYLKKALKLQPDVAVIVDSFGWLLFKQGQYERALDYLQRAYAKQPQSEIAGHLVEVMIKLNKMAEAKELLNKALEQDAKDDYLLKLKNKYFVN